jgi:hypothetical protein
VCSFCFHEVFFAHGALCCAVCSFQFHSSCSFPNRPLCCVCLQVTGILEWQGAAIPDSSHSLMRGHPCHCWHLKRGNRGHILAQSASCCAISLLRSHHGAS